MSNETKENTTKVQVSGFRADIKAFTTEQDTMIHAVPGGKLEIHINLYKAILGIPFEKVVRDEENRPQRTPAYGFLTKVDVFTTKDKQTIIHKATGFTISKPANYYRKIIESHEERKVQKLAEAKVGSKTGAKKAA